MTTTNLIYERLLDEWESELRLLEGKIFNALRQAGPEGLTRRQLVYRVYGIVVPEHEDLNNNAMDRKIRKTIAKMFDDLIPILSSSSTAGYRLDVSETSIRKMIAEWTRRREQYNDKVRRAEQLILKIRQYGDEAIPVELPVRAEQPKQLSLIEGL